MHTTTGGAGTALASPTTPARARIDGASTAVDDRTARTLLSRGLVVTLGAAALVAVAMARLTGSVSLFLSPDGGHYLTDAAALLGDATRPLAHPPAFPALVAAGAGLVEPVSQVHWALAVSLWALIVALYVLCRQYTGFGASLVGAGVGATFPAIAELLAWNGGATLLATAFLVLALAACEWWLRTRHARGALLVGLALAGALLAHPFVAMVAAVCVGVRWIVERIARRRGTLALRDGPFSFAHLALVALPLVCALPIVAPYYRSIEADAGVRFGVPRMGSIWDTLVWGLREQGALLLVFLLLLVAAALGGRGPATWAGALGLVYLVIASASRADPSYRTRVAYLLPIVGALGAAIAFDRFAPRALERLGAPSPPRGRPVVVVVAAVLLTMVWSSLGFLPRIPRAAAFYQRLDPVDVTALASLRGGDGLVATSWNQNSYGNGISNAWYVEGLAARRSAGPTDPALSTIRREQVEGAAMQQFFSGNAGVENGALQLSAGPQGSINDPGLQVMLGGMYRPVLSINDEVSGYPAPLGRGGKAFHDLAPGVAVTHRVTDDAVVGDYRAGDDTDPLLTMRATLDGHAVDYRYTLQTGDGELVGDDQPAGGDDLAIRLFPGYGILWRSVRSTPHSLRFVADPYALTGATTSGDRGVSVTIRPVGDATIEFLARDPQFGLQSVEIGPDTRGRAHFRVEVATTAPTHPARRFDEATLARELGISDVVLWKDTGWRARFADDRCYGRRQETARLLVYSVDRRCLTRRSSDAPEAVDQGDPLP